MKKTEKKAVREESKSKPGEEKVDYVFEFSLPKDASEQFEQFAEEVKVKLGKLFKLFIARGIKASLLARQVVAGPDKRLKAAKAKTVQSAVPETLVIVDLAKLPPHIADYIGIQAANQNVPLQQHLLDIIEAWFGYISGDDALNEPKNKGRKGRKK